MDIIQINESYRIRIAELEKEVEQWKKAYSEACDRFDSQAIRMNTLQHEIDRGKNVVS